MTWTAPRTWVTGEIPTGSTFNVHLRDNLDYLKGNAGVVAIADSITVTAQSATALAVGRTLTNTAFTVDSVAASSNTGWKVTAAAAAGRAALAVISSGTNEGGDIDSKGSGTLRLNVAAGTGAITLGTAVTASSTMAVTGNFTGSGTNNAFNVATNSGYVLLVGGTVSGVTLSTGVGINTVPTLTGSGSVAALRTLSSITVDGAAAVADVAASIHVTSPTITLANGGLATVGAGIYVTGAAVGATTNYAIFCDGGVVRSDGSIVVNDAAISSLMTTGITIQQGTADDEILAFQSSDVATGMTDIADTDTFATFTKDSAAGGGLRIRGLRETTTGLALYGLHVTDNTTKSTAGIGAVHIVAQLKSGTGIADCGADANLMVIRNNATTRFIFDAEGSAHADVEWIAFDAHDDLQALDGLTHEFARRRDPAHAGVTAEFGAWLSGQRDLLERAGIVNFDGDGPRAMVNTTRLQMLEVGALRQLGARLARLEAALGLPTGYSPMLAGGN